MNDLLPTYEELQARVVALARERDSERDRLLSAIDGWRDFWLTYSSMNEGAQDDMSDERNRVLDEMDAAALTPPGAKENEK